MAYATSVSYVACDQCGFRVDNIQRGHLPQGWVGMTLWRLVDQGQDAGYRWQGHEFCSPAHAQAYLGDFDPGKFKSEQGYIPRKAP